MASGGFKDKVRRGEFDSFLIRDGGLTDTWTELREEVKSAELRELLPANMSRMARMAYRDSDWVSLTPGGSWGSFDLARLQRLLWWLYRNNWLCANVINNLTYLTMAGGFNITWATEALEKRWKEWAEENRWLIRQREIIKPTFAYGEWFTLLWPLNDYRSQSTNRLKTGVRGIDPWNVKDPTIADDDPEKIEYWELEGGRRLRPEDVVHHRVEYLGNYRRGLPICLSILDPLYWAEKCLQNQHWLHHIRCRIPMVVKVDGPANDVDSEKSRFGTSLPKPGTIRFANRGTEITFPDLNIGSSNTKEVYRLFILAVAQGVGLPEFLVGASAEQSAYASLLAQESPAVQKIIDYQMMFACDFRRIVKAIMGSGEFTITPSPVVQRDVKKISEAFGLLFDRGIVSAETVQRKVGLIPEDEKVKLAGEKQANGDFVPDDVSGEFAAEALKALCHTDDDLYMRLAARLDKTHGKEYRETFTAWVNGKD